MHPNNAFDCVGRLVRKTKGKRIYYVHAIVAKFGSKERRDSVVLLQDVHTDSKPIRYISFDDFIGKWKPNKNVTVDNFILIEQQETELNRSPVHSNALWEYEETAPKQGLKIIS